MPTFDVIWNRTRLQWTKRAERAPWVVEAILLERTLLAGKPQLRIVCRLARYVEYWVEDPAERDRFWHDARARLGRLHRLSPRDHHAIEALLVRRVPKPSPLPQAAE
jgi:hypothetical protein